MTQLKVGVSLYPQHCSVEDLRSAWREAEQIGADSCWVWDHFFPLTGDPDGRHFECWSLLACMAADTTRVSIGPLVSCVSYRNPDLLADIARTVDHISKGRLVLGLGAGWFEKDYNEYGFEFETRGGRLDALEAACRRIKERLAKLNPGPLGPIPILIGGSGEKKALRIVASQADAWNTFGPIDNFKRKADILRDWCSHVGRDPAEIEKTVLIQTFGSADALGRELKSIESYVEAGADHLILGIGHPFDLGPLRDFVDAARDFNTHST
jgi:probable F420-dependent oxidoreductase